MLVSPSESPHDLVSVCPVHVLSSHHFVTFESLKSQFVMHNCQVLFAVEEYDNFIWRSKSCQNFTKHSNLGIWSLTLPFMQIPNYEMLFDSLKIQFCLLKLYFYRFCGNYSFNELRDFITVSCWEEEFLYSFRNQLLVESLHLLSVFRSFKEKVSFIHNDHLQMVKFQLLELYKTHDFGDLRDKDISKFSGWFVFLS